MRVGSTAAVTLSTVLFVTWLVGFPMTAVSAQNEPDAREIMISAFDRVLYYPSVREVRLLLYRDSKPSTRREFQVIYQKFGDGGRALLRFTEPEYLRNESLLIIQESRRPSEAWIFQPAVARPRRISLHQQGDSFYGSDLAFADLEHRDWSRYEARFLETTELDGRAVYRIEVKPPPESPYSRFVVTADKALDALSSVDFFVGSGQHLDKTLTVDLDKAREEDGVLKVPRFTIESARRGTKTIVEFKRIDVDEEIRKRVFSTMRLQSGGEDLFDLVERSRKQR